MSLGYLGIYEQAIQDVVDTCDNALDMFGATLADHDALWNDAMYRLREIGDFGDITNSIIEAYFESVKNILAKFTTDPVTYYVNCTDSHLYIAGEEIF